MTTSAIDLERIVEHHTSLGEHWLSSGVQSDYYIDLRDALLCGECREPLVSWYDQQLAVLVPDTREAVIVGTGVFGALLVMALSLDHGWSVAVWNEKAHGRQWVGKLRPRAVLVDDVITSGGTMARMAEAVKAAGSLVVGEVVARRRST